MSKLRVWRLACAVSMIFAFKAQAAEPGGCDKFTWSVEKQLAAFNAPGLPVVSNGSARNVSSAAFVLKLAPTAAAKLPNPPERAPKESNSFAGYASFAEPSSSGPVQVSLSGAGWIDVIQGGNYLKPTGFSGVLDCAGCGRSCDFSSMLRLSCSS